MLLPGKEADVVRGQIYIAKVCEKREYEALSYTWGSANKTTEISIQDMTVSVTQSLHWPCAIYAHQMHPELFGLTPFVSIKMTSRKRIVRFN